MKRLHSLIGLGFLTSTAKGFVIQENKAVRTKEELSAFTTSTTSSQFPFKEDALNARAYTVPSQRTTASNIWDSFVLPVLGASFLITGNTVGAGCLVMPELTAEPGLLASTGIFSAAYIVNLVSGLLLAQVAIHQREMSAEDVPASFQEFAEANLKNPLAANGIAAISIFVNGLIQSFDISRAGVLGVDCLGVPAGTASCLWATLAAVVVGTQSTKNVSQVSSMCVTLLFATFAAIVIPGMAAVSDPMGTLTASTTSPDNVMGASMEAAPVILIAMIYQNIVPTVVKLLDYDRAKVTAALITGSFIPLVMYLCWCYTSLGGGIQGDLAELLLSAFSIFAIAGSTLGTSLSLSEEIKNFVPGKRKDNPPDGESSNMLAAGLSLGVPLSATLVFSSGSGFTEALNLAGSFGSPLLYGIIPVAMVWKQQQDQASDSSANKIPSMVPNAALPVLGSLSVGFVAEELFQRFNEVATYV
jgi:tyrosine-specific transport protein